MEDDGLSKGEEGAGDGESGGGGRKGRRLPSEQVAASLADGPDDSVGWDSRAGKGTGGIAPAVEIVLGAEANGYHSVWQG